MTSVLPIHETFQQTLQGEGFWAGTPVDFIRLAGCPVRCPWCDTGYADGGAGLPREMRTFAELLGELKSPRVVISGGEPFLHEQLPDLIAFLEAAGKTLAVETSGAFWREVSPSTWVTLSPKQHVNPRYPVRPQMWERANEFKLVVETGLELEFYAPMLRSHPTTPVFLQPEWTQRDRALPLILDLLQQFPQYRLSVQLHKYLQIP